MAVIYNESEGEDVMMGMDGGTYHICVAIRETIIY